MNGSIESVATHMVNQVVLAAEMVSTAEKAAELLYTAPVEIREFWQNELKQFGQLKAQLQRYTALCDRAERALVKGLKRKRWELPA